MFLHTSFSSSISPAFLSAIPPSNLELLLMRETSYEKEPYERDSMRETPKFSEIHSTLYEMTPN
jgi:hypothetical protein